MKACYLPQPTHAVVCLCRMNNGSSMVLEQLVVKGLQMLPEPTAITLSAVDVSGAKGSHTESQNAYAITIKKLLCCCQRQDPGSIAANPIQVLITRGSRRGVVACQPSSLCDCMWRALPRSDGLLSPAQGQQACRTHKHFIESFITPFALVCACSGMPRTVQGSWW